MEFFHNAVLQTVTFRYDRANQKAAKRGAWFI